MRHTVQVVWLLVLLAAVGAQDNHRDAFKPQFRKFVSKVRGAVVTTPPPPPPPPTSTRAPTEETPPAAEEQAKEETTEAQVAPEKREDEAKEGKVEGEREASANATGDAPPNAEKLFGLPDLRTHLIAQQQRQQQLALDVLRAAAQTPSFGPSQPFQQQPSVSDLQQLLRLMQQAQQGNHFSFYAPQPYGQQQPSYQSTPAFFAPSPAQFGLPLPAGVPGGVPGGVQGLPGPHQQHFSLPYNPPPTPTYVFRDGAFHVQQQGPPQPADGPPTRFSVATPVPSAGVHEPQSEPPRPPTPNYVNRVQFGNAVFQRPGGGGGGFAAPQQPQEALPAPPGPFRPPAGPFQPQEALPAPPGPFRPPAGPYQPQEAFQPPAGPFQRPPPPAQGRPPLTQQQQFFGPQQQQPGFGLQQQQPFGQQQPQGFGQQQPQGFGQQQQGFGGPGPQSFNNRAPVFFPPQSFTSQEPESKGGEGQVEAEEKPEENLVLVSQVRGSAQR